MSGAEPKTIPPMQLFSQMLNGRMLSKGLMVAAELGIADHVKNTPTAHAA